MFGKKRTDVLVAGAGPVGLLTALRLTERGVRVQVVDKQRRTGLHGYALALHPGTLELLDQDGLATELIERGRRIDNILFMDGPFPRRKIAMAGLKRKFPFALVIPQKDLESILEARLRVAGVRVLWNHRLQNFEDKGDTVVSEIARLGRAPGGYPVARLEWVIEKILTTTASFLVGADGYHSLVRNQLEVPFKQVAPEETFAVFEFDAPTDLSDDVRVIAEPGKSASLWPMSDGRCRFSFQVQESEVAEPTLTRLNDWIKRRAPWFPTVTDPLHWSTLTHFDRRLVERFGRGRVWLAGDAAHLASPLGTQSLNVGLAEAASLATRIADVMEGVEPLERLADYDRDWHRAWRGLHGLCGSEDAHASKRHLDGWIQDRLDTIRCALPATGDDLTALMDQFTKDASIPLDQG